ncbi:hypothetical protein HDV00_004596 [Rhizophlyctis rosea]|nr:hypothetical protein HDV00_004596 [Rhizophlyctis rosea]
MLYAMATSTFQRLIRVLVPQWVILSLSCASASPSTGGSLPYLRIANNEVTGFGKPDNGTLGPALETFHLFNNQVRFCPPWEIRDEIKDGEEVPYPNQDINWPGGNKSFEARDLKEYFVSVQSVVLDGKDRLWVLDTGRPYLNFEQPPSKYGGPKLVGIDINSNEVFKSIIFPQNISLPTSYPNDVRFDLNKGPEGTAYITDSSDTTPALIVVDLSTGTFLRRLASHPFTQPVKGFVPSFDGIPMYVRVPSKPPQSVAFGADSIAITANASHISYCPLSSRRIYSVPISLLADSSVSDDQVGAAVRDYVEKGSSSDGLETDSKGVVYLSAGEQNAIYKFDVDTGIAEPFVRDARIQWPDTLSVTDGYLYFTSNQFFWQHGNTLLQKTSS